MSRINRVITARNLNGDPGPYLIIKANRFSRTPVYLSAPRFALLDEDTALELADTLVDIVESMRTTK